MLDNKSILITGGTGSLGKELVKTIFAKWPDVKRLVVYSRDEQKQFQMTQEYPVDEYRAIRFFHWRRARPRTTEVSVCGH